MAEAVRTRYPGAQPFSDDALSRRLFFGREQESTALTHQILANRLVVLFARSGLGKTSMLNAGVAQSLRAENFLPMTVRVNDAVLGPLESVYRGIADACARQGVEYVEGDKASLWRFFKTAEFWGAGDLLLSPVLILDQFEELFTLQPEPQRAAFVDQLSYLVRGVRPKEPPVNSGGETALRAPISDSSPRIKVVVSLREDFLAYLEELSDRIPEILDQRSRLLPLARTAAAKAMEAPAVIEDPTLCTRPFELDPGARDAILGFLQRRSAASTKRSSTDVEPFQLQIICQHVEAIAQDKQRNDGEGGKKITLEEIGGEPSLRRMLKDFYTTQVAAVASYRQRQGVRRLCSEFLISPQGRRLRMEESEIKRLTRVKPATLQTLVDRRLLRADQNADGIYYELSHDSLIMPVLDSRRPWFWFRAVLLLIGALTGLVMLLSVFGAMVAAIVTGVTRSDWYDPIVIVLLAILAFSLWYFGGPVVRSFRRFMELLRRTRK